MRYMARVIGVWIERQGERLWSWGAKKKIENFYANGLSQKHIYDWNTPPAGEKPW